MKKKLFTGDRAGRRVAFVGGFLIAGIAMLIQTFVILHDDLSAIASFLAVFMKFFVSITFYVVNLQSMETYPTCLRQTGISIGAIVANGLGVLGPFIVYLVSSLTFIVFDQ